MKDGGRCGQRKDSSRRKFKKRKKNSGSSHKVVESSSESRSDMEWQPWMCLQDSGKKKGNLKFCGIRLKLCL